MYVCLRHSCPVRKKRGGGKEVRESTGRGGTRRNLGSENGGAAEQNSNAPFKTIFDYVHLIFATCAILLVMRVVDDIDDFVGVCYACR
jgi:hypothetical protein